MTTFVQSDTGEGNPAQVQFGSDPTEKNLLLITQFCRTGQTGATLTGSTGWTKILERNTLTGLSSARRSLAVWAKISEGDETGVIELNFGTGTTTKAVLEEYNAGDYLWAAVADAIFESNDDGDQDDNPSIATGTTANVPTARNFVYGVLGCRNNTSNAPTGATWSSIALTAQTDFTGATGARHISTAWDDDNVTGTRASTATLTPGTQQNQGLSAAIIVFALRLEGDVAADVETPDADLEGTLDLDGDVAADTATPDAELAGTLDLDGDVAADTATPDAELTGTATLAGTIAAEVASPDAELAGTAKLAGDVDADTATPDAELAGTLDLDGDVAADTATPDAELAGTVDLAGDIASEVETPVSAIGGNINQQNVGGVVATTPVPEVAIQGTVSLAGDVAADVESPDAELAGSLMLEGDIASEVETPDAELAGSLMLEGDIASEVETPDAELAGAVSLDGTIESVTEFLEAAILGDGATTGSSADRGQDQPFGGADDGEDAPSSSAARGRDVGYGSATPTITPRL